MKNPFASRRFKPDEIVVALDGFVGVLDDGKEVRIAKGARIRGGSDAAKKWPEFFALDGATGDELQAQREAVFYRPMNDTMERAEMARQEEEARRSPPQVPLDKAAQVIHGFSADGHSYGAGELVLLDADVVKKHPEYFQLPARPLVP